MPSVAEAGWPSVGEKDREKSQHHRMAAGRCCQEKRGGDGDDDADETRQRRRRSQESLAGKTVLGTSSAGHLVVAERERTGQTASRVNVDDKV